MCYYYFIFLNQRTCYGASDSHDNWKKYPEVDRDRYFTNYWSSLPIYHFSTFLLKPDDFAVGVQTQQIVLCKKTKYFNFSWHNSLMIPSTFFLPRLNNFFINRTDLTLYRRQSSGTAVLNHCSRRASILLLLRYKIPLQ